MTFLINFVTRSFSFGNKHWVNFKLAFVLMGRNEKVSQTISHEKKEKNKQRNKKIEQTRMI